MHIFEKFKGFLKIISVNVGCKLKIGTSIYLEFAFSFRQE